ncbi:hypothetical protein ACDX78_02270 [Virgibacillus oceani]
MEIKIVGSTTKVKEKMKKERQERKSEIAALERKKKKAKGILIPPDQERLNHLERTLHIFSVSSTLPADFDGLIINGKLLQAYLKKLKGCDFKIEKSHETTLPSIKLWYGKERPYLNGLLELYPLNHYFEDYEGIPKLEIHYDFLD